MADKAQIGVYISLQAQGKLRAAAKAKGVSYSEWVEHAILESVKTFEEETGKKVRAARKRPYVRKAA